MNLPGIVPDRAVPPECFARLERPALIVQDASLAVDPGRFLRSKTMSLTMYAASIPVFQRMLLNLDAILRKGQAHAEAQGFDPLILASARLYPNMLPLTAQVFIAADMCKGAAARLTGQEAPAFPDSETTLVELSGRVGKTLAYLETFRPAQFEGSEARQIVLNLRTRTLEFVGQAYLTDFVLPNLYFHATTCYGILRHNGVVLGKSDFLGG
jgi:hypothetical protein